MTLVDFANRNQFARTPSAEDAIQTVLAAEMETAVSAAPALPPRRVDASGESFLLIFPYDARLVEEVRHFPSRKFQKEPPAWVLPRNQETAKLLSDFAAKHEFAVTPEAQAAFESVTREHADAVAASSAEDADLDIPGLGGTLRPFQKAAVKYALAKRRTYLAEEMGLGKAQPLDAKVLTPIGWKQMGEIQPGDFVISANGRPTEVLSVYPQGMKAIHRVEFSDGSSTECCDEHLWEVNTFLRRWRKQPPRILPLKEIRQHLTDSAGNRRHFIPMVQPVEFKEGHLPLHPYLLGALLGDGGIAHSVMFSTTDGELIEKLKGLLPQGTQINHRDRCDYRITGLGRGKSNSVMNALRELGLMGKKSGTKFIPKSYLYSSSQSRTHLLQGLLDTDGHVRPADNNIEFTSVSRQLAEDVRELVLSLGGTARIRVKRTPCQLAYRMSIALPPTILPFSLSRKASIYHPREKYPPSRSIKSVVYVGIKEAQCIRVAAIDGLYVTDDYIVTHNTVEALATIQAADAYPAVVICPASLKLNWQREAEKWLPGKKVVILNGKINGDWEAADVVVLNYDILGKHIDSLKSHSFKAIILDECHAIKSHDALRTKHATELAKGIELRLWLSGTPILNRPKELLAQLKALGRLDDLGGFWHFVKRYCLPGDAPILMADLTEKSIQDVRVGDKVIGWSRIEPSRNKRGGIPNRRLCEATVLNVLIREASLQRVILADGTVLVCTPNHRWLNGRSGGGDENLEYSEAKTGRLGGRGKGVASRIVHILDAPSPFYIGEDYMRGYLEGVFRGDGWCSRLYYERQEKFRQKTIRYVEAHRVGMAMKDLECIERVKSYLSHFELSFHERQVSGLYRIEMNHQFGFEFFVTQDFDLKTDAWWAGFLGGIYDAEGSGQIISQYLDHNPRTYALIKAALERFHLPYHEAKDKKGMRLQGGRSTLLRFWQIANPALKRKLASYVMRGGGRFSAGNLATMKSAPFVKAIEPLPGVHRVYTLTTTTGNYVAYGCGSKNCNGYQDRYGWNLDGAAHLDELHDKLRATCYVRHEKAKVLKELPPKTRALVPMALDNREEYEAAEADVVSFMGRLAAEDKAFRDSIADLPKKEQQEAIAKRESDAAMKARRAEQLVRFEALKRCAAKGKMAAVKEWVGDFLDSGEKLVLFAWHQDVVNTLADAFNAPSITGATPLDVRQASVDKFQGDPNCKLIVCNIQAGGLGLTLTAASNAAFMEYGWNLATQIQAEDRCHRIGQAEAVNIWNLVGEDTIDEEILALIAQKAEVVDAATDGRIAEGSGMFAELAERIARRKD